MSWRQVITAYKAIVGVGSAYKALVKVFSLAIEEKNLVDSKGEEKCLLPWKVDVG